MRRLYARDPDLETFLFVTLVNTTLYYTGALFLRLLPAAVNRNIIIIIIIIIIFITIFFFAFIIVFSRCRLKIRKCARDFSVVFVADHCCRNNNILLLLRSTLIQNKVKSVYFLMSEIIIIVIMNSVY